MWNIENKAQVIWVFNELEKSWPEIWAVKILIEKWLVDSKDIDILLDNFGKKVSELKNVSIAKSMQQLAEIKAKESAETLSNNSILSQIEQTFDW